MCFGRNEMNEKIIRQIGDCKVNITFGESNPGLKDEVLWRMTEYYKSRIIEGNKEPEKPGSEKKTA